MISACIIRQSVSRSLRAISCINSLFNSVIPSPSFCHGQRCLFATKKKIEKGFKKEDFEMIKLEGSEGEELNKLLGYDIDFLASLNDDSMPDDQYLDFDNENPEFLSQKAIEKEENNKIDIVNEARIRGFLELNPYLCSGCGAPFQSKRPDSPGFLEKDKLKVHLDIAKFTKEKQLAIKALDNAGIETSSTKAVELLRSANVSERVIEGVLRFGKGLASSRQGLKRKGKLKYLRDISANESFVDAAEVDIDGDADADTDAGDHIIDSSMESNAQIEDVNRQVSNHSLDHEYIDIEQGTRVCQRCYRLRQYGKVEDSLRPGWSEDALLTPERFESLLGEIKENSCIVICVVDLFDLQGSLLPNLRKIMGKNPLIVAANKVDLLPADAPLNRLKQWVYGEVRSFCRLRSPREVEKEIQDRAYQISQLEEPEYIKRVDESGILKLENIHLISCQTGFGIESLMKSASELAQNHGKKIYVMGAANVGKSSFLNRMIETSTAPMSSSRRTRRSSLAFDKRQQTTGAVGPQATVSNIPGTTLDFLKVFLPQGITLIDTPGLLTSGQLTARLTTEELKVVIPSKPINPFTVRLEEGRCVLIGGLGMIELIKVSKLIE